MGRRLLLAACALLAVLAAPSSGLEQWSLEQQAAWTLDNSQGSNNVTQTTVTLPSCALSSLYDAGVVTEDPLYRFNELAYRWIARDTWTWTASFPTPAAAGAGASWELRLDTIDGPANLTLNGVGLGTFANSHRPALYNVTGMLRGRGENNTLVVTIASAADAAAAAAEAYPYAVPAVQQKGALPNYNFARKAASDFGWDWGPAFAPACVLGNVTLSLLDAPALRQVAVSQSEGADGGILFNVTAFFSVPLAETAYEGELVALLEGVTADGAPRQWEARSNVTLVCSETPSASPSDALLSASCAPGDDTCQALALPDPVAGCRATLNLTVTPPFARWWPWELGQPQLSDLAVRFAPRDQPSRLASRVAKRVGLRTARLVTEPIAQTGGETFYFEVNGVPVYARGANVIPSDVLESRVRPSDLAALVRDARRANMNMLRVWGGGRYAQEAFYAAADAAGILVWQEFMAACAAYPRERAFLGEVALEARHQLARLSAHPSIVLWGGNNEVEASFTWSLTTMTAPQKYASDYTTLFVDTLRPALLSIDPQLAFVDTSPSKGLASRDPYVKRWGDLADPSRGDVHFYDYASDALDPATYPAAKFVSEYGFMSFPSFSVYRQVSELGDWAIDAPLTDFRLRHANGVQELRAQMLRHFVSDADTPPAVTQFDGPSVVIGGPSVIVQPNASATPDQPNALQFRAFVHLSQVQQALAYETAAGVWRRGKADAEARTMGLLYWQLNDVWQGPSWSGINYGGQWKLLHHAARRFFAPVYLSAHRERGNGTVVATVVNDLSVDVRGTLDVDVILYAARTASEGVVSVAKALPVTVPALGTATAWRDELAALSDFVVRSAAPNQLTFDSDYVVRLRFCPQSTGAVEGLPDPWAAWRPDGERWSSPAAEAVSAFDCESEGCVGVLDEAAEEARGVLEELLACSEATFFPVDFGEARLWGPPPTINATPLATDEDGSVSVRLSTDTVALFVTVEPPPGVSGNFNASGVLLLPWEPQTVVFTPEAAYPEGAAVSAESASRRLAEMTPEDFAAGMYIRSLQGSLLDYDLNGSVSSPTSWAGGRHSLGIVQALALAAATIVFALF